MKKKEFAVGEVFQLGLKKLKVVEDDKRCAVCYLYELRIRGCSSLVGSCWRKERTDKKNVAFVEVEEEE